MKIYFDFETTGLLRQPGLAAHCMAYAIDAEPVVLCVGHAEIRKALAVWIDRAREVGGATLVAHYGTGFDIPVLRRLFSIDPEKLGFGVRDTKVLGSLYDPEFSGTHSLADWGTRVKAPKDNYQEECKAEGIDPWAAYTPRMGSYCVQDVVTLRTLDTYLAAKYEGYDWGSSVALEHAISAVMAKQAHNGWWFDMEGANKLVQQMQAYIAERTEVCKAIIKPKAVAGDPVDKPFKKDGKPTANAVKALGDQPVAIEGPFSRVSFSEYDLDSRHQVLQVLQLHGWKPTEWTDKGNPKFTEDSISAQLGGVGKALAERFVAITRLGQLRGWMEKVRDDGRIEAKAMSQATPTGRMRHSVVVNVPRPGTMWGPEMRALFGAKPGCVQVGVDAAGLELRMLAHYMGDPVFTKQVVEGDVHWHIAQAIGLVPMGTKRNKDTHTEEGKLHELIRNAEKTWIYGMIYGAGDEKLGTILLDAGVPGYYGTKEEGALTRERMMTNLPKYGKLMERIEDALWHYTIKDSSKPEGKRVVGKDTKGAKRTKKRDWLQGLDGRKLYIRHDHAALNMLLQSAGSIVVKAATVYADRAITQRRLPAKQVGHFHDEAQYECADEATAVEVGKQFIAGIKWAAHKYAIRCPLDGEAKTGRTWADCH